MTDSARCIAALSYLVRGWWVFPCKLDKSPYTAHGFKDATQDPEQVRAWWQQWPDASIGIDCERSGLTVIDKDPRHGGEETLARLRKTFPLTDTYTVATGGEGEHFYYASRPLPSGANKLGPGLDVKSAGGYVIAAGSGHESGREYRVRRLVPVAALPEWLERRLLEGKVLGNGHGPDHLRLGEGERNQGLTSLAGAMRRKGYGTEDILERLLAYNAVHCEPPLAVEEVRKVARSALRWKPGDTGPQETEEGKPIIRISTDLPGMADAAEAAVRQLPGPVVYQRARRLCHIAQAGPAPKYLQRPADTPVIAAVTRANLDEFASRAVEWQKFDERRRIWKPTLPHGRTLDVLAARSLWRFPPLEGLLFAPTIRADGVLLTEPGYDHDTGLYLDFHGTAFPAVPPRPTRTEAQEAVDVLYEPFLEFPFKEPCHGVAVVAAILTLVGRFAIAGNIPLFAVRSTRRGSGKGLLIDAIATIGTGRPAPTWTQVIDNPDEERKQLLAVALEGAPCLHIDNVTAALGSAPLDSAITSRIVEGRLLGTNTTVKAPWLTLLFASGNNMVFHADTARRTIPIDLDPQMENPEERTGFLHTPLLEWVARERPRLIVAALTILKAYIDAGSPREPDVPEFGSFEAWAGLVRHALLWLGYDDPCGPRRALEAQSDVGYERHALLLQAWEACYDTRAVTVKVALQDAERRMIETPTTEVPGNSWNELFDALMSFDEKAHGKRPDSVRVGNALRKIEGAVIGNKRLVTDDFKYSPKRWKVETL